MMNSALSFSMAISGIAHDRFQVAIDQKLFDARHRPPRRKTTGIDTLRGASEIHRGDITELRPNDEIGTSELGLGHRFALNRDRLVQRRHDILRLETRKIAGYVD